MTDQMAQDLTDRLCSEPISSFIDGTAFQEVSAYVGAAVTTGLAYSGVSL
jgi:hypothetical protein